MLWPAERAPSLPCRGSGFRCYPVRVSNATCTSKPDAEPSGARDGAGGLGVRLGREAAAPAVARAPPVHRPRCARACLARGFLRGGLRWSSCFRTCRPGRAWHRQHRRRERARRPRSFAPRRWRAAARRRRERLHHPTARRSARLGGMQGRNARRGAFIRALSSHRHSFRREVRGPVPARSRSQAFASCIGLILRVLPIPRARWTGPSYQRSISVPLA